MYLFIHIIYRYIYRFMFYCPFHIWDLILPIDELIFFRGVDQLPTSWDMGGPWLSTRHIVFVNDG